MSNSLTFQLPDSIESKIDSLVSTAIALSELISDDFLDYIHSEFWKSYRENLISGTKLWHEGVYLSDSLGEVESVNKQIMCAELIAQWITWSDKH